MGRPTKYERSYSAKAKRACKKGATIADLAILFDVAQSTVKLWMVMHHEFSAAVKVGRAIADEIVEMSLYQRAQGYEYKAVKIMQFEGDPIYADYMEHVPADVGAAKLWLTNRRPKDWAEKTETKHGVDESFVTWWKSNAAKNAAPKQEPQS